MRKTNNANPPTPVKHESRICFGISWFKTEAEAKQLEAWNKEHKITVNGGMFHGMPCGRAPEFDSDDPAHGKLYACRT